MRKISAVLALSALLSGTAAAAAWESKTMQDPLAAREVNRGLNLPKGWAEFGLGMDAKFATGNWTADGELNCWEDAALLYTTERFTARYGFSHSVELYGSVPFHYISLTNEALGTDTSGTYVGDPRFGLRKALFSNALPLTSVVFQAEMKVPAGNEDPGSYISGPGTFSQFVTTTGTQDLSLSFAAKRELMGNLAVGGSIGYVHRFSSIVHYLIELEENQGSGRIKPGAQAFASANVQAQLGPVALDITPRVMVQGDVQAGTTSGGLSPDSQLEYIDESGGWYADIDFGLTTHVSRNVDLVLGASIPLRGEDLMFFPIEDIHPTYGNTYSGSLKLRY